MPQGNFLTSHSYDFRETPFVNIMIRPLQIETGDDLHDMSMKTSKDFVTLFWTNTELQFYQGASKRNRSKVNEHLMLSFSYEHDHDASFVWPEILTKSTK